MALTAFDWVTDPNDRKALEEYLRARESDKREEGIAALGTSGRRMSELITGVPSRDPGYKPQNVYDWLSQRQILSQNKTERRADDDAAWQGKVRARTEGQWPQQDEASALALSEAKAEAAHKAKLRPVEEGEAGAKLEKMEADKAFRTTLDDPNSSATRTLVALGAKYLPNVVKPGMKGSELMPLIGIIEKFGSAQEQAELRRLQIEAAQASRDEARAIREQTAAEKARGAQEKQDAENFVGDYFEPGEGYVPGSMSKTEQPKFITDQGEAAHVANTAKQIETLFTKTGHTMTGPDAATLKTLVTDLRMRAKGPAVYNLGVLNGQDFPILQSVIDQPGTFESIVKNEAKLRDFNAEISTFRKQVSGAMRTRAGAWRLKPSARVKDNPFAEESGTGGGASAAAPQRMQGKDGNWYVLTPEGWTMEGAR